jgi:diaminopropionate ammonia-lyase
MVFPDATSVVLNPNLDRGNRGAMSPPLLSSSDAATASAAVRSWPGYAPTSLRALPGLSAQLGVAAVSVKLEGERFVVASFKALGPPYALEREIARRSGTQAAGCYTAVAATSGNHGRALAWGARRLGARAKIFMPAHTSRGRAEAIQRFGATVVRVTGDFDDALAAAVDEAQQPDRILITDLPSNGREDIARDILAGYSVLGHELIEQSADKMPTHVFVAAGNGTLAAAVCARLWLSFGAARPIVCTVEPAASDALRRSLLHGMPQAVDNATSIMDGLVVRSPSRIAWPILRCGIDAGIAVSDATAIETLRALAEGRWSEGSIEVGETGVAALAGLVAAAEAPAARQLLDIGGQSRLLAVLCEGVTDREVYRRLVAIGCSASGE